MEKHTFKIKENTLYQLNLRKDFLEEAIDKIEEYWEEYGGLDNALKEYKSIQAKDDNLTLEVHKKELDYLKKIVKLLSE